MLVQEEVTVLQGNRQVIRIQLVSLSQVLFHQLSVSQVTDNRGCLGIQLLIILVNRQPFLGHLQGLLVLMLLSQRSGQGRVGRRVLVIILNQLAQFFFRGV